MGFNDCRDNLTFLGPVFYSIIIFKSLEKGGFFPGNSYR